MARRESQYRLIRRGGRYDGNSLNLPPLKADIPRPPWKAGNPIERRAMIDWVVQQLEKREYVDFLDGVPRLTTWWVVPCNPNAGVKVRYSPSEIKLLRILQQAAGFSTSVKRDREDAANSALADAVDTVPLIRKIWQDEYEGRKNRTQDDGASAEEIAATLFGANLAHVLSRSRKPSGVKRR
jgi:hypothetical protein